jgi:Leucine-rich repeat (LRR) protein
VLLLGGNKLSGPIPASLAMASRLEDLSLANNSFTGHVPPEIGMLCLVSLELSNNRLTATDAGGWEFLEGLTNCSALLEISLNGNRFGGAMPGSITRLSTQLQKLNLGGNRISGVMPPDIGNLQNLETLDLRSNLLTGEIPEGIGKLTNLQELNLQENRLSGPVPSSIGNLWHLLSLNLSSNLLNGSVSF